MLQVIKICLGILMVSFFLFFNSHHAAAAGNDITFIIPPTQQDFRRDLSEQMRLLCKLVMPLAPAPRPWDSWVLMQVLRVTAVNLNQSKPVWAKVTPGMGRFRIAFFSRNSIGIQKGLPLLGLDVGGSSHQAA